MIDLLGRGLLQMRGGDWAQLRRRGLAAAEAGLAAEEAESVELDQSGRVIHTARCICHVTQ